MIRHLIVWFALLLAGCSGLPQIDAGQMADKDVLLVVIGGNSESINANGMTQLYIGKYESILASSLRKAGLGPDKVLHHYYTWTGDEADTGPLPRHWSWITGSDERIKAALDPVLAVLKPGQQVVILGWSNGGDTAYDLACTLRHAQVPVDLLVTLDPVSWTNAPCAQRVANRWINVFTASGPGHRLKAGNIIALLGGAWDDDRVPTRPDSAHRLFPADHGDTKSMWTQCVLKDPLFMQWAEQRARDALHGTRTEPSPKPVARELEGCAPPSGDAVGTPRP